MVTIIIISFWISGGDLLENVDQTPSQSASKKMGMEGPEPPTGD